MSSAPEPSEVTGATSFDAAALLLCSRCEYPIANSEAQCERCLWEHADGEWDEAAAYDFTNVGEGGTCKCCGSVQDPFSQCLDCGGPVEPDDGSYHYHFGWQLGPQPVALAHVTAQELHAAVAAPMPAGDMWEASTQVYSNVGDGASTIAYSYNTESTDGLPYVPPQLPRASTRKREWADRQVVGSVTRWETVSSRR